ncbi:uncharacterized protein LOC116005782 [Ipomoea triloba]|uniref:uncharacterized protein LOC116005782 n=1 Tax=Ipomoea triloba TaxID=35885 RepID=UPI00125D1ECE|nr:uncharacterized protein LOC116005782 [Ipomoea triloba]
MDCPHPSASSELKTLGSFFKPQKSRKPKIVPQTSSCVFRDELDKKPPPPHCKKANKKQVKFDLKPSEHQSADPEYGSDRRRRERENNGGGGGGGGVVRVKVLMRREEANRLLSRCGEGGALTFMDVADELKHIPLNHITVISSSPPSSLSVCDDKGDQSSGRLLSP